MRVPFNELKDRIKKAFLKAGLTDAQAEICAQVHAESSRDGVYSHGLNRVPRFISYIQKGWVNPNASPTLLKHVNSAENYDGNLGIGILNAKFCMNRAIELAKEHGIGMVTLRNTTHWMRGGTYAWDAANAGYIGICWTNTESSMPVWGAKNTSVGNNPFCFSIPRKQGNVVLDMAMSQYSYGKLEVTRLANQKLPFPGGYNNAGELTDDPREIEESMRILPTGYWKGSGMAIILDIAAAILSNGLSGNEIDQLGKGSCTSCSQVFIAIDPKLFANTDSINRILDGKISQIHNSTPVHEGGRITYPGERTLESRKQSTELGVLVDENLWEEVCRLSR